MIPYGRQSISATDIDTAIEVLRSDWLTQGPAVPHFEAEMSGYCQVPFAIAVSHGTAALHLACLASGLGPGDRLWTSPITFVASANCARYCGAKVDFVDIDPRTCNMSVEALETKLREARHTGALPKVVVAVHFAGQSCDMSRIRDLGREYGFRVIEDASHALGGEYQGAKIGTCSYSDAACFSFHPVKSITTAEGGMVVTRDRILAARIMLLRSHGITRDTSLMEGPSEGGWYYQQIELGFNYRLNDIQAALGTSQLTRLDKFIANRGRLADIYDQTLQGLPLSLPWRDTRCLSAWHLYVVRLAPEQAHRRNEVFGALRSAGIGVHVHYIPVHLQPYYRRLGFNRGDFPEAESYYSAALTLPMFADMTEAELRTVAQAVGEALS